MPELNKQESWEKEIDKWYFDFANVGGMYLSPSEIVEDANAYIKSFIRSQRQLARKELLEEQRKKSKRKIMIEGVEFEVELSDSVELGQAEKSFEALKKALEKVNQLKEE